MDTIDRTPGTIGLIDALAPEAHIDVLAHETLTYRHMDSLAGCETVHFKSYTEILEAVENGTCRYGIVPIRHSTRGMVDEVASYWFRQKEKGNNMISVVAEELIGYGHLLATRFHLLKTTPHFASGRHKNRTSMIVSLTEKTGGPEDVKRVLASIRAEEIFFHPVHTGKPGLSTFYVEFVSKHISAKAVNPLLSLWTKSTYVLGNYASCESVQ